MRKANLLSLALSLAAARPGECVIWPGRTDRQGYGRTYYAGKNGYGAHRAIYEITTGPIPDGMTIDHQCFIRNCVQPGHLALATRSENCRRQRSARKAACVNGHEFTPENTYIKNADERSRGGRRGCRACNRAASRAYQARRKGTA